MRGRPAAPRPLVHLTGRSERLRAGSLIAEWPLPCWEQLRCTRSTRHASRLVLLGACLPCAGCSRTLLTLTS